MMDAQSIIDFWFSDASKERWFNSSAEFDQYLKDKYLGLWEMAEKGELRIWREEPLPALALVIILDQLPLNIFRGLPESFSTEEVSRDIARYAIDKGFDNELPNEKKSFLYLPFMHSEDIEDQNYSVKLFTNAGMETRWAEHHRNIIKKFGRFPHRNAILGRKSTDEEIQWLSSDAAFNG